MKYGRLGVSTISQEVAARKLPRLPWPGNLSNCKLPERFVSQARFAALAGERAAVKWKLSTSAWLAMVAGTCSLTPLRSAAQQPEPSGPATQASTAPAAYDALAVLNGSTPDITQEQRDEAAQRLLSRHTAQARQTLHDALVAPNQASQLAVARALALDPDPDPSFFDPLFPLLENRELAAAAGRALAGYKSEPEVLTRLIDRATSRRNVEEFTRLAAIRAIGTLPEKRAADTLRQLLISPNEPPSIHTAAAEGLVALTGLDQNGVDPGRWEKWWDGARNKSDAQFRMEIEAQQDARLDRLDARYHGLVSEVETLLRDEYQHKTKSQSERQSLMLTFLNSPEPEIRKIGTRLLGEDVVGGNGLSPAELQRLRDMIADSDPGVRRAVADAIGTINDPAALDALLNQLAVEPDPTVRAAIARALGPIQNLRAVPTLINLLSDESLETAVAAAHALGDLARGPLPGDPTLAHKTADALRDTILKSSQTPGRDELRAACIQALAPLQQTAIIQELIGSGLMNASKESVEIRKAMLVAIGALNDGQFADVIGAFLSDPELQEQAIASLSKNPRAADYAGNVGALLKPDPSRPDSVREEAWSFLQDVFPLLSETQLNTWQQQLKDSPERQLLALEALADKQQEAKHLKDLAITRTEIGEAHNEIGEAHNDLKQYSEAAASYGAALQIYNGLPPMANAQALLQSLISNYEQALLDGKKFTEAIALAADRIQRDPSEQSNLGPIIAQKAEQLAQPGKDQDLAGAQQLIDQASKMSPPLDGKYQARLNAVANAIK